MFFQVNKFDFSLKKQIRSTKKIYSIDSGLRNAVSFKFSEDLGRLAENIIFIDLLRRGKKVYYWKNKQEVDFVIKEKKISLIQVCWDIKNKNAKKRELAGLLEAMEHLKLKSGILISEDYFGEEKIKGKKVICLPLWVWLLREN